MPRDAQGRPRWHAVSGDDAAALAVPAPGTTYACPAGTFLIIPPDTPHLTLTGDAAINGWMNDLDVMDFLRDQYRHGKPMLMLGGSSALLQQAGIPATLPDGSEDDALLLADAKGAEAAFARFKTALAGFRQAKRDANAPKV